MPRGPLRGAPLDGRLLYAWRLGARIGADRSLHRQEPIMSNPLPSRRNVLGGLACSCTAFLYAQEARADETPRGAFLERPAEGTPHQGKVLLAVQAHSDDIPLMAGGVVAKLVREGYTGYLLRATNDDMGDAPDLGTVGTIGDHVLGNERDNAEVARVLGRKKAFDLNYAHHRLGDP